MSGNNSNGMKKIGLPTPFSGLGTASQSISMNNQTHFISQIKPQNVGGSSFPGHFQISEPQAQPMVQSHFTPARSSAQFQVSHSQFQTPPQTFTHFQNSGNNNVGVSSPGFSTPSTGSARRALQKPPSRPPSGSSGANTGSPLKAMELAPAAQRKKQKLNEKQIPERVAALLPESALYTQLLEFEARVDAALSRKKMNIYESLKNPPRIQKVLRIYVYNTFANQAPAATETNAQSEPPSWSLKIIGRILEDGSNPTASGLAHKANSLYPKFSSFFKKITIYLDQTLYPDNHVILWENARSPDPQEGFEVKRKGNKEFTAIIRIEMNYAPEKFKLSPALSEVIGIEVETRQRVIVALWHYIKARKLQILSDPSFFMCDPPLKKVFGEDKLRFTMVPLKLSQHLTPPQPIHLEHRIKLSGSNLSGNSCYDVLVDVPISLEKDLSNFLVNLEKHKEIDACDDAISAAIKKIHEHRRRRAFFLGFSQSPAEFINGLIASQSRDLKLVAGDGNHIAEREHRSEFYHQPWAEDAVIRYLNRKSTTGSDAPGST